MTSGGCGPNTLQSPSGMGALNVGDGVGASSGPSTQELATAFALAGGFGSWQRAQVTVGLRMRPMGLTASTSYVTASPSPASAGIPRTARRRVVSIKDGGLPRFGLQAAARTTAAKTNKRQGEGEMVRIARTPAARPARRAWAAP